MAQRGSRGSADPGPPFLLEAHFYEGGLRNKSFGSGAGRPAWVPPSGYVGFRNEFTLEGDDSVVEFSRFAFQDRRVTWIGVFKRSVDQVFGDRQNYAGVGVWLLETNVIDADNLLISLNGLASEIADGKMDAIAAHANNFTGEDYLPKYLKQVAGLPDQLGGWPYRDTGISETAFYLADGRQADESWEAAADQILRMSILPGESPAISRALILVPAKGKGNRGRTTEAKLQLTRKGFAADLLSVLPTAIAKIADENLKLAAKVRSLTSRLQEQDSALKDFLEAKATLQTRVSDLEGQLKENDVLRRLTSIDQLLKHLGSRTGVINDGLREIRSELSTIRANTNRGSWASGPPLFSEAESARESAHEARARGDSTGLRGENGAMRTIAFVIFALVAVLLVIWLFMKIVDGGEPAENSEILSEPATKAGAAAADDKWFPNEVGGTAGTNTVDGNAAIRPSGNITANLVTELP